MTLPPLQETELDPVSYRVAQEQEMDQLVKYQYHGRQTIVAYAHLCLVAVLANLRAEGVIPKFTERTSTPTVILSSAKATTIKSTSTGSTSIGSTRADFATTASTPSGQYTKISKCTQSKHSPTE